MTDQVLNPMKTEITALNTLLANTEPERCFFTLILSLKHITLLLLKHIVKRSESPARSFDSAGSE